jgi:hypothetical protein
MKNLKEVGKLHMFFRIIIISFVAFTTNTLNATEKKQASDVFKKWSSWQQVLPDHNLAEAFEQTNRASAIKACYEQNLTKLRAFCNFLAPLSNNTINKHGHHITTSLPQGFTDNLSALTTQAENNIPAFIHLLKTYGFTGVSNASMIEQINAYSALAALMFAHGNEQTHQELMFACANRFFEFCFAPQTAPAFQQLFLNKQDHAIVKIMYAVMWDKLAGSGWKHWHQESLNALKQEADDGKTIVYLAGGSDIYQMITHGIYSIHIIDPQLPTQPKYYADQWDWLIKNSTSINAGLGDKIIFNDLSIVMKRTYFHETGEFFSMQLSNGSHAYLAQSVTQWTVLDLEDNILGTITFERRPLCQKDFELQANKTMLMSFNELYFIALPQNLGGWGIEPAQFPRNFQMIIKQLRKPVSKTMIGAMRNTALLNASDLKFIDLGTCVN